MPSTNLAPENAYQDRVFQFKHVCISFLNGLKHFTPPLYRIAGDHFYPVNTHKLKIGNSLLVVLVSRLSTPYSTVWLRSIRPTGCKHINGELVLSRPHVTVAITWNSSVSRFEM